jgi:hypothetical protein
VEVGRVELAVGGGPHGADREARPEAVVHRIGAAHDHDRAGRGDVRHLVDAVPADRLDTARHVAELHLEERLAVALRAAADLAHDEGGLDLLAVHEVAREHLLGDRRDENRLLHEAVQLTSAAGRLAARRVPACTQFSWPAGPARSAAPSSASCSARGIP